MLFNVHSLAEKYALNPKQVRSRLASLQDVLEPLTIRGQSNSILLNDAGMAVFDRLIQLEREGHPQTHAIEIIRNERLDDGESDGQVRSNSAESNGHVEELLKEFRSRIISLENDKQYLQEQLRQALETTRSSQEQVRALLPGPQTDRASRWNRFKQLVTGK